MRPPCAGCTIERDYDYGGSDLETHSNVESAENCAVLCGSTSGCMSWTYGKKQGQAYTNKCFLKSSVQPNRQVADCCDSGLPCNYGALFGPRFGHILGRGARHTPVSQCEIARRGGVLRRLFCDVQKATSRCCFAKYVTPADGGQKHAPLLLWSSHAKSSKIAVMIIIID